MIFLPTFLFLGSIPAGYLLYGEGHYMFGIGFPVAGTLILALAYANLRSGN